MGDVNCKVEANEGLNRKAYTTMLLVINCPNDLHLNHLDSVYLSIEFLVHSDRSSRLIPISRDISLAFSTVLAID